MKVIRGKGVLRERCEKVSLPFGYAYVTPIGVKSTFYSSVAAGRHGVRQAMSQDQNSGQLRGQR